MLNGYENPDVQVTEGVGKGKCQLITYNEIEEHKCMMSLTVAKELKSKDKKFDNLSKEGQMDAIELSLKEQCEKTQKTTELLEACLFYNGNMKWPQNQFANLCLTNSFMYAPFQYPYLNKYYCLGWNTTALEMQMLYD